MFNFFKKKPVGKTITLRLSGLHCSSCSLNIDNKLEDLEGVLETYTSYAKQETKVTYDPKKVKISQIKDIILSLGYDLVA